MDEDAGPPRGYYGTVASRGLGRMAMEELTLRLQPDAIEDKQVSLSAPPPASLLLTEPNAPRHHGANAWRIARMRIASAANALG